MQKSGGESKQGWVSWFLQGARNKTKTEKYTHVDGETVVAHAAPKPDASGNGPKGKGEKQRISLGAGGNKYGGC